MRGPRSEVRKHGSLDRPAFGYASYALLVPILVGAAYLLLNGRLYEGGALVALFAGAVALIAIDDRLPRLFTLLFVLAGAINAAGYTAELWGTPVWFDEFVHVFTPFTVTAAAGWLLFHRRDWQPHRRSLRFLGSIVALGVAIGVTWEVFEYVIGIIGGMRDTVIDLVCDTIGAILAGLFCIWAARREPPHEQT